MSFKNNSDVHNHLSTKHPLFPRKPTIEDNPDKVVEPVKDPEPVAVNIPVAAKEESSVSSF